MLVPRVHLFGVRNPALIPILNASLAVTTFKAFQSLYPNPNPNPNLQSSLGAAAIALL